MPKEKRTCGYTVRFVLTATICFATAEGLKVKLNHTQRQVFRILEVQKVKAPYSIGKSPHKMERNNRTPKNSLYYYYRSNSFNASLTLEQMKSIP